jgi:hypothetical protein
MSRLIQLYPRPWRDRYEAEFLSLMTDRPPSLGERFDIVRGAVDARLHPQVRTSADAPPPEPERDADLRIARRLGIAAAIGAVVWPIAFGVMLMGPVRYDDDGAYRDGAAAFPAFILAIVLLVGGLFGHLVLLPNDARFARACAILAIPLLLLFSVGPWMWQFGLAAFSLVGALAVGGFRAGSWPRWATTAVVVSCLVVFAIVFVAATAIGTTDRMVGGAIFLVAALILIPTWIGVAAPLIRQPVQPTLGH